jgi:hypothetical protein
LHHTKPEDAKYLYFPISAVLFYAYLYPHGALHADKEVLSRLDCCVKDFLCSVIIGSVS